mgnify:CR=1 FL=1
MLSQPSFYLNPAPSKKKKKKKKKKKDNSGQFYRIQ